MRSKENEECGKCGEFNHNISNKKNTPFLLKSDARLRFHRKIVHYFLKL